MRILAPNGGEIIYGGASHTVTWMTSTSPDHFQLRYFDGSGWSTIDSKVPGDARGYTWTVPTGVSTDAALFRVVQRAADNTWLGRDDSEASFTITDPSSAFQQTAPE